MGAIFWRHGLLLYRYSFTEQFLYAPGDIEKVFTCIGGIMVLAVILVLPMRLLAALASHRCVDVAQSSRMSDGSRRLSSS